MTYLQKLQDPRWQKKRLEILKRDSFKCRDCGSEEKTLHVHHSLYQKGDPWETHENFLRTCCADCHTQRQVIEREIREYISGMSCATPIPKLMEVLDTLHRAQRGGLHCRIVAVNPDGSPPNDK